MKAAELIREIHRHGGDVTVDGNDLSLTAPQPLPTGLLNQLRNHKAELLDYLNRIAANTMSDPDAPSDPAAETRRRAVLAMLAANLNLTYAITTDDECASEFVLLTLAIRGKATAELQIPKAKYNGLAILQMIEQRTGGTP
jgi:hypothetical protein